MGGAPRRVVRMGAGEEVMKLGQGLVTGMPSQRLEALEDSQLMAGQN